MIILITGASHTGKTLLAQRILETYRYPYLSMDLLKMGLIRSGNTPLTPEDDAELVDYLWPIVREMVKTAIENHQNLVVEGGYIPFDWQKDFSESERNEIRFHCLVMTAHYIRTHFDVIQQYAGVVEDRGDDSWCTMDFLLAENAHNLKMCQQYGCHMTLIDETYRVEIG